MNFPRRRSSDAKQKCTAFLLAALSRLFRACQAAGISGAEFQGMVHHACKIVLLQAEFSASLELREAAA